LSAIAAEAGFSDQAHMTRAIAELTGKPPSHWRA
jgi:AraC-like DNA-binding protein